MFLKLAGYPWIAVLVWNSPALLRLGIKLFAPWIAASWSEWYALLMRDLSKMTWSRFCGASTPASHGLRPGWCAPHADPGCLRPGDKIVDPRQARLLERCRFGWRC